MSECLVGPSRDCRNMCEKLFNKGESHNWDVFLHQKLPGSSFLKLVESQFRHRDRNNIPDRFRGSATWVNLYRACRGDVSVPVESRNMYRQLLDYAEIHKSSLSFQQMLLVSSFLWFFIVFQSRRSDRQNLLDRFRGS